MIVICGATGKIGGTAARLLRARALPVRAVVRDASRAGPLREQGCAIAEADLRDVRALTAAFEAADAVLVICPLQPEAADVAAQAHGTIDVIAAALDAARPRHVVAISDYGAHVAAKTGITMIFHRLEQQLRAVPVTTTFVRSAEHMQNWFRTLRQARATGTLGSLHHPVTREFPTVSAFDVGVIAAQLLAASVEATTTPRVLHVEGPRRYAASDVAAAFAQRIERAVSAYELPRAQWSSALAAGGLRESYAQLVCELQDAHNAGKIEVETGGEVRRGQTDLPSVLGPQARS
jgi:NAD(P)H dehydrogenase (quinone)